MVLKLRLSVLYGLVPCRELTVRFCITEMESVYCAVRTESLYIRCAQVKVGLINLCKGLFSLNARIYHKLKSGT